MGSDWELFKLEDIAEIKSGKRLPKGHSLISIKTKHPYIRLVDVDNNVLRKTKIQYLRSETQKVISRYIVNSNDVCLAIVGHTIGVVFYIEDEFDGANLTENAARITNFNEDVNSKFVFYYLCSPAGKQEILSRKVGSAQGKLPMYNIKSFEINLPDKEIQDVIVNHIDCITNKIELNRQINQTLEQMAQTLFKSWFIDFDPVIDNALKAGNPIPDVLKEKAERRQALGDKRKPLPKDIQSLFPNAFVFNEELDRWVPKGWRVGCISDIADVIGGGTPSTKVEEYFCKDGISWLSPKDLSGYEWKYISKGATDITELGLKQSSAKLMPKGSVLFSSRAPIGYVAIAENEVSTNQGFKSLVPINGMCSEYLFYFLKQNINDIEAIATGSTFKEVSGTALKNFEILIPSDEILNAYDNVTKDNNDKRLLNQKEVESLTKLRDTLLPKLIKGELRVKDLNELTNNQI